MAVIENKTAVRNGDALTTEVLAPEDIQLQEHFVFGSSPLRNANIRFVPILKYL